MLNNAAASAIKSALMERFGEDFVVDPAWDGLSGLATMSGHRSHRRFAPRAVDASLLRLLCACALSAPSKSDLQQCDIVIVNDAAIRKGIVATIPDMPWIEEAPVFLVFVGNGQRLSALLRFHDKPFPNDHLDQFFNAAVDGAIVMSAFMCAAAAVGLGFCPISAIRDNPQVVSELLRLPTRVFPIAGLCLGWPSQAVEITPRLALRTTVIADSYGARDLAGEIDDYDRRRAALRPYRRQRNVEQWGTVELYGWSEDKARQYAEPTRTSFGRFIRGKGFCLD